MSPRPSATAGHQAGAAILGGRIRLAPTAPRPGLDPALLAAAVPAAPGDRFLDAGAGAGAAALYLAARVEVRVDGIEIRPELVAAAAEGIALSGLAGRVRVIEGDITAPPAGLTADYDHVMANPPYFDAARHQPSSDSARAAARHDDAGGLARWIASCLGRVRRGGTVSVIHRAERLGDIVAHMAPGGGGIRILPLWPGGAAPAKLVIVRAVRGSAAPLALYVGLALHRPGGGYTDEAEAVLRHGAALTF
jgi:tRNA1Val (adenine37-N6)-methyltransferase